MCDVNPMYHMDVDYMWRWFVTSEAGSFVAISANAFFKFEDAKQDWVAAQSRYLSQAA